VAARGAGEQGQGSCRCSMPRCAPAVHPVAVGSIPDSVPNISSIACFGGDLARPGPGPADRGTAGAMRRAARRRPGHRPRAGRQGRALPLRGRHQGLEPDAARAATTPQGIRPAAGRLHRPSPGSGHPTVALRELSGQLPDVRRPLRRGCLAGGSFTAVVPYYPGVAHRLRANRGPRPGCARPAPSRRDGPARWCQRASPP
jgi:hypothetical protein